MSWARLDDKFHSHPKLQRAQRHANAVAGLYARALSYCADMLTDGFVDGYWARSIATPKELALTSEVGLWVPVDLREAFEVTNRKDSGRRRLADVTVLMPAKGFFIEDYLHFNPSRMEVLEKREKRTSARTVESADDARLSAHTPDPSPTHEEHRAVVRDLSATRPRPGPVDRLLEVCVDAKGDLRKYVTDLGLQHGLGEGDYELAREAALSTSAKSPTAVAISVLKERAGILAVDGAA